MKFNKLRCVGFKSFVEPTEFLIEEGLTGIVGPNGCGKSNLVEALRWVMGENSYKNMRASGMDDVIFSGSAERPSRNTAEVLLFLDNCDRTAPAAFNDSDELQVARRIEREAGSAYRINGREVRAKDVQLLFADASTGARSPSMVGQGRIGELISAKPQARRALLEEAAGISGLHSRRHEAELRLRAADQNLERLEDVLAQLDSQIDSLKRQARQANRYRNLSGDIRKAEALAFHLKWSGAKAAAAEAQSELSRTTAEVGEKAQAQAAAARAQADLASGLPDLRNREAEAAAALQRLTIARNQIDEEVERIAGRKRELETRLAQLDEDLAREQGLISENTEFIERLGEERNRLASGAEEYEQHAGQLRERLEQGAAQLARPEQAHSELTNEVAASRARRAEIDRIVAETAARSSRLAQSLATIEADLTGVVEQLAAMDGPARAAERVGLLEKRAGDAEADADAAEAASLAARTAEQEFRQPHTDAATELSRIETEISTLTRILESGGQDMFPAVIEQMRVTPGYETALGAALGADLDLPVDEGAPARWTLVSAPDSDPALPQGAAAMSEFVKAPPELSRRLAQVGIVELADADRLVRELAPGQLLVTIGGDIWRWDGYVAGADAPTAAAQKLAQRNRLAELSREKERAVAARDTAQARHADAKAKAEQCADAERQARETWRQAGRELSQAREQLLAAERSVSDLAVRRDKLSDSRDRLKAEIAENDEAARKAGFDLAGIPDISRLEAELQKSAADLAAERATLAEVRAESDGFAREMEQRRRRVAEIDGDLAKWSERVENARDQISKLEDRRGESLAELEQIADAPEEVEARRAALSEELDSAESKRRAAADSLAEAENRLADADRTAKATQTGLADAREARIRAEERLASAEQRCGEIEARLREELSCEPSAALGLAELGDGDRLPELASVENRLEKLKAERERLGAVNLRAEAEQTEIVAQRDALISERDDLVEAIKRLRTGIASLNREGRERLLEAFELVNGHFRRLFAHLFDGGTAELQLIESDDPLEAGLEILARPPGKRPQTMTLLSGGEQALTALALIFAVFLTNPAPICVLDEVDAPLDDHNVERFCNLMDEMVASTQTRFVIITHNPITMARMNRLFGVTMAERGVSEIVSVDLDEAERLREAG